jgi:hypothetical protein
VLNACRDWSSASSDLPPQLERARKVLDDAGLLERARCIPPTCSTRASCRVATR